MSLLKFVLLKLTTTVNYELVQRAMTSALSDPFAQSSCQSADEEFSLRLQMFTFNTKNSHERRYETYHSERRKMAQTLRLSTLKFH